MKRLLMLVATSGLLVGCGAAKSGSTPTRTVTVASTQGGASSTQSTTPSNTTGPVPLVIAKGILAAEKVVTEACEGRSGLDPSGAITLLAGVYQRYPRAVEFRRDTTTVRSLVDEQVTYLRSCRRGHDLAVRLEEAIRSATGGTRSVAPSATGQLPEVVETHLLSSRKALLGACEHKESAANVEIAMAEMEQAYKAFPNAAEEAGGNLTVRNRLEQEESFLNGCRPDLAKQLAETLAQ